MAKKCQDLALDSRLEQQYTGDSHRDCSDSDNSDSASHKVSPYATPTLSPEWGCLHVVQWPKATEIVHRRVRSK